MCRRLSVGLPRLESQPSTRSESKQICLLPSLLFRGGCQDASFSPLTPIATMDGRAILVYSVSSHELLSLKAVKGKEIYLLFTSKCFKLELWHFDYEGKLEFWVFL